MHLPAAARDALVVALGADWPGPAIYVEFGLGLRCHREASGSGQWIIHRYFHLIRRCVNWRATGGELLC